MLYDASKFIIRLLAMCIIYSLYTSGRYLFLEYILSVYVSFKSKVNILNIFIPKYMSKKYCKFITYRQLYLFIIISLLEEYCPIQPRYAAPTIILRFADLYPFRILISKDK